MSNVKDQISIKDFKKLDIRTGTITEVEKVSGSDKLLKMQVNFGDETRQIVAGLAEYYSLEEMEGKIIVVLINLKPAKIFGQWSYGMLLAAEKNGELSLITADRDIQNGAIIT
jgi:methionine--tRNA ligase beta chain